MFVTGLGFSRQQVQVALVAALSAGCWFAWMGWDRRYDVDPRTGQETGPYEPWQVKGCLITLIVLGLIAAKWLSLRLMCLTVPSAFTAAWCVSALQADGDGLWGIGAGLVMIGMVAGTLAVAGVGRMLWNHDARRRVAQTLHDGLELYRHPPYDP